MTVPPEKARLLDEIASALAKVPNVEAVALGGSHARGTHGPASDLDIGIYYREAAPVPDRRHPRHRPVLQRQRFADRDGFYEWGPFVNGGAWIDNAVCKVDFLYRNLDQLERMVAAAERGEWEHSFDQHPPFGFRSVTTLGEIHIGQSLHDPKNALTPLKAARRNLSAGAQGTHRPGHAVAARNFRFGSRAISRRRATCRTRSGP